MKLLTYKRNWEIMHEEIIKRKVVRLKAAKS